MIGFHIVISASRSFVIFSPTIVGAMFDGSGFDLPEREALRGEGSTVLRVDMGHSGEDL